MASYLVGSNYYKHDINLRATPLYGWMGSGSRGWVMYAVWCSYLGTARWPGPGLHEDDELSSKFQQQPSFKIIIIIIHYPSYFKGWYELFAIRASCSRQSYTTKTEQRTVMVIWVRLACALHYISAPALRSGPRPIPAF